MRGPNVNATAFGLELASSTKALWGDLRAGEFEDRTGEFEDKGAGSGIDFLLTTLVATNSSHYSS
jgi:hypothetical protein